MISRSLIQEIISILIGKSSYSDIPLYIQDGDTCTVASLISAILIWNADQKDAQINVDPIIVHALNRILIYLEEESTNNDINKYTYDKLKEYRDSFQKGNQCTQLEYQTISNLLYHYIYNSLGLGYTQIIDGAQRMLSLYPSQSDIIQQFSTFDEIFSNDIVQNLKEGEISQICWNNRLRRPHTFLIGRLQNGEWFWYDQAGISSDGSQAFLRKASILNELKGQIDTSNYPPSKPPAGAWTGARLIAPFSQMIDAVKNIVQDDEFLAEVDYGIGCWGEKLRSKGFVSRHYAPFVSEDYTSDDLRYHALEEAKRSANDLRNFGALIVEKPKNVFSVYKTNLVEHDCNTEVEEIDLGDSGDGLLSDETKFHSAWLCVKSKNGSESGWFKVF